MEKLNNVFQAASQEMYNAANAEGANPAGDAGAQGWQRKRKSSG